MPYTHQGQNQPNYSGAQSGRLYNIHNLATGASASPIYTPLSVPRGSLHPVANHYSSMEIGNGTCTPYAVNEIQHNTIIPRGGKPATHRDIQPHYYGEAIVIASNVSHRSTTPSRTTDDYHASTHTITDPSGHQESDNTRVLLVDSNPNKLLPLQCYFN